MTDAVAAVTGFVQLRPTHELIEPAITTAAEVGCSTYDALYDATAEQYDAMLATADLKLGRQLAAAQRSTRTRILGA